MLSQRTHISAFPFIRSAFMERRAVIWLERGSPGAASEGLSVLLNQADSVRLQKTFWEASPLCCGSGSGSGPRGASAWFAASSAKGSQCGVGVHTRPAAHVCVRGAHSALRVRVAACTRVRVSCFPPVSGSAWPESRLRAGGWQGNAAGPGEALGSDSLVSQAPHRLSLQKAQHKHGVFRASWCRAYQGIVPRCCG